ncbi:hypothetical protein [Streptomyces erythrochromogenes]|uniref:hypothetical protein n=1 Tax=Streptomyces erythrochromogenes TaxID=285574 RepID=UPI0037D146D6
MAGGRRWGLRLAARGAWAWWTGPDHVRTHRVTLLAAHAAGLPHLYPEAGEPWQPVAVHLATHPDSGVGELGPLLARVDERLLCVPDAHVDAAVDISTECFTRLRLRP